MCLSCMPGKANRKEISLLYYYNVISQLRISGWYLATQQNFSLIKHIPIPIASRQPLQIGI